MTAKCSCGYQDSLHIVQAHVDWWHTFDSLRMDVPVKYEPAHGIIETEVEQ